MYLTGTLSQGERSNDIKRIIEKEEGMGYRKQEIQCSRKT
jgi:hypothetical protein